MINNKFNKKAIVPIRNVVTLLFIISFTLVFFIESSRALVCFCGKCFPVASQNIELKIKSTSSKGSSKNNIKICNIEKGKTLKGAHSPKQVHDSKIFFTSIVNSIIDISSVKPCATNAILFHDYIIVQSFPISLKTLSIRC